MGRDRSGGFFSRLLKRIRGLPDSQAQAASQMDPITRYLLLSVAFALLIAAIAYWFYNRTHLFDTYEITASTALEDVEGTQYEQLSGRVIKYSHDGVFCVNTDNDMLWSSAYSMQTPVCHVSGSRMVIVEQQGDQVVVLNAKGVLGSFTTPLPIMKARISSNGVVALVLKDKENVSWVNLYNAQGEELASVKASQAETGYPMDIALSDNGRQLLVSFLCNEGSELAGRVALYDFSSLDSPDESHLKGSVTYTDVVFPEVFFGSTGAPVAVADDGFIVFSVGKSLKEKTRVQLPEEIVSVFHDASNIGFVFRSVRTDAKYRMQVCSLNGRTAMETEFDFSFSGIRMENGEILVYDASTLQIYRTSGKPKLNVTYGKEVEYFTSLGKNRRYLVITPKSIDRIRIS